MGSNSFVSYCRGWMSLRVYLVGLKTGWIKNIGEKINNWHVWLKWERERGKVVGPSSFLSRLTKIVQANVKSFYNAFGLFV